MARCDRLPQRQKVDEYENRADTVHEQHECEGGDAIGIDWRIGKQQPACAADPKSENEYWPGSDATPQTMRDGASADRARAERDIAEADTAGTESEFPSREQDLHDAGCLAAQLPGAHETCHGH